MAQDIIQMSAEENGKGNIEMENFKLEDKESFFIKNKFNEERIPQNQS